MNPRRSIQKVAVATISSLPGVQKFHFREIPVNWVKVDVREALHPKAGLMYPSDEAGQNIVADAVGSPTLWDQKYIKSAS